MKLFQAWSLLFFATIISVSKGFAAEPGLIPITDPTRRFEFEGFSILPPKGENWFMPSVELLQKQGVTNGVQFWKMLTPPSVTHTIVANVSAVKVPMPSRSRAELLQELAQVKEREMSTGRHRLISIKTTLDNSLGSDCLRYDVSAEDRGALVNQGSVYILDTHGFACLHPDITSYLIEAEYSQRRLQGEQPLSLEAEGEAFLKTLVFTKSNNSAQAEHEAFLERVKTNVRKAYCRDPVTVSCIGDSESICQAQLKTVVIPACSKKFLEQTATTANDAERKIIFQRFFNCILVTHLHVKYRDLDIVAEKMSEVLQCRDRLQKK